MNLPDADPADKNVQSVRFPAQASGTPIVDESLLFVSVTKESV